MRIVCPNIVGVGKRLDFWGIYDDTILVELDLDVWGEDWDKVQEIIVCPNRRERTKWRKGCTLKV